MGLSIYKSDIDTISDYINIINYKQKNIENVINTINNSVNTLKANCYGTTVSVMCFKLNNLKHLPILNSMLVVVYDYNITLGEFSEFDTVIPGLETKKFIKFVLYATGDFVVSSLSLLVGWAAGGIVGGLIGMVSVIVYGSPGGVAGSAALGTIGLASGATTVGIWGAYAANMLVNNYEINGKTISEDVHGIVDYCVDGFFDWIGL